MHAARGSAASGRGRGRLLRGAWALGPGAPSRVPFPSPGPAGAARLAGRPLAPLAARRDPPTPRPPAAARTAPAARPGSCTPPARPPAEPARSARPRSQPPAPAIGRPGEEAIAPGRRRRRARPGGWWGESHAAQEVTSRFPLGSRSVRSARHRGRARGGSPTVQSARRAQ